MNFIPRVSRVGSRRPSPPLSSSRGLTSAPSLGWAVHRHVLHYREAVWGLIFPYTAVIILEGYVRNPPRRFPMHRCERTVCANNPASGGNGRRYYHVSTVVSPPTSQVDTIRLDAGQTRPFQMKFAQLADVRALAIGACPGSASVTINRPEVLDIFMLPLPEPSQHVLVQSAWVRLQREHVIRPRSWSFSAMARWQPTASYRKDQMQGCHSAGLRAADGLSVHRDDAADAVPADLPDPPQEGLADTSGPSARNTTDRVSCGGVPWGRSDSRRRNSAMSVTLSHPATVS